MPEEGDEKPFKCGAHGCGQTFTNEDHLTVHRLKHQMSLTLTPGTGNKYLFADQTPTPTKFLRYGEEIGLFNELVVNQLSKNPFDDAFKQATEGKHGGSSEGLAGTSTDQDTLNTPTPHIPVRHPDTPDTPFKKRYRFLDPTIAEPDPDFIPLPGPAPDSSQDESAVLGNQTDEDKPPPAKRERVESNLSTTTLSSLDNSMGPLSQESQSSILEISSIDDGNYVQEISSITAVTQSGDSVQDYSMESSQSAESSLMSPPQSTASHEVLPIITQPNQQQILSSSSGKGIKLEKIASNLVARRPDSLSGLITSGTQLAASSLGSVTGKVEKAALTQNVPILPSPVATLSNAIPVPVTTASGGTQQYMLQVMVQTPEGKMMPVHIPAALAVPNNTNTAVSTMMTSLVSSTKTATATSSTPSQNVSLLTKRKLKEAIQQNSPLGNKTFVSSVTGPTTSNRTASVSSQFSPSSYSNPPTPRSSTSDVEYQAADSSVSMSSSMSYRDDDSDDKRKKFLERNRAAAARCRNKKKKWVNTLEYKAEELQSTNTRLQNEVTQLRAEMAQLKALLLAHKDCPITIQQRNAGQLTLQKVPDMETSDVQMVPVANIPIAAAGQHQTTTLTNQQIITQITNANKQPMRMQYITLQGGGTIALKQEIAVKQETGGAIAKQITLPNLATTIQRQAIGNTLGQGQIMAVDLSKVTRTLHSSRS